MLKVAGLHPVVVVGVKKTYVYLYYHQLRSNTDCNTSRLRAMTSNGCIQLRVEAN